MTTTPTTTEPTQTVLSAEEEERYQELRNVVIKAAKEWKRMSYTRTRLSRRSKDVLMLAVDDLCAFERHFHLDKVEN
jgi:hypothetical protein